MVVNESDILTERSIMNDFWSFRKKYYYGEAENDNYWNDLIADADAISRKYKSLYADMLLCVCVTDIENRFNQSHGKQIDSTERLTYAMRLFDVLRSRYSDGMASRRT